MNTMTAPMAVPMDVRLMNFMASVLLLGCTLLVVLAAGQWVLRHPVFAIARIVVQGELTHNNAVTLRANLAPQITGNFFTVNLKTVRDAFQQVAWVRKAEVSREFPQTLRVQLQEHHAAAHWGFDGENTMVNQQGEIFEANGAEADLDALPRLSGPPGFAAQVLAMSRELAPVFDALGLELSGLELSARGGWLATLDGSAQVEIGGGTPPEVVTRTRLFAETLSTVAAQYGRRPDALESADLRHTGGYALKLRGVTTVSAAPPSRPAR